MLLALSGCSARVHPDTGGMGAGNRFAGFSRMRYETEADAGVRQLRLLAVASHAV